MVNQDYLPHVIAVAVVELLVVIGLVLYRYRSERNKQLLNAEPPVPLLRAFFTGLPFEAVYRSRFKNYGAALLLSVRIVAMVFFIIFGMVEGYVHGYAGVYFTFWNINTISIYFTFATAASILGFVYDPHVKLAPPRWVGVDAVESYQPYAWSDQMQCFSYVMQMLSETMGSAALYITVVVFLLLDPYPSFGNLKNHFITSVAYVSDLYLSGMVARWEHVVLVLVWVTVYLTYIWPVVATGHSDFWPYFFLSTSSPAAVAWYTGLFLSVLLLYAAWYGLSQLKERYATRIYGELAPLSVPSADGAGAEGVSGEAGAADGDGAVVELEMGRSQQRSPCHSRLPANDPAAKPDESDRPAALYGVSGSGRGSDGTAELMLQNDATP